MSAVAWLSKQGQMNAMRTSPQDCKVWLSAFLFPFKIYTVVAVLPLIIWHGNLPPDQSSGFNRSVDYSWHYRISEFCLVADYVRIGYFIIAFILLAGGLAQFFVISRKAAFWSLIFGMAALIIGILLWNYCQNNVGVKID